MLTVKLNFILRKRLIFSAIFFLALNCSFSQDVPALRNEILVSANLPIFTGTNAASFHPGFGGEYHRLFRLSDKWKFITGFGFYQTRRPYNYKKISNPVPNTLFVMEEVEANYIFVPLKSRLYLGSKQLVFFEFGADLEYFTHGSISGYRMMYGVDKVDYHENVKLKLINVAGTAAIGVNLTKEKIGYFSSLQINYGFLNLWKKDYVFYYDKLSNSCVKLNVGINF